MSGQQPPANWYPDPSDPSRERYWDGAQWTSETRDVDDTPPPPPVPPLSQGLPPGQTSAPPPSSGAPAPPPAYLRGPHPQGPAAPKSGMSTTAKVLIALGVFSVVLLGGCVALITLARTAVEDAANELEDSDFAAEIEEALEEPTEATVYDGAGTVDDGGDGQAAGDQSTETGPGTREDPLAYGETVTVTWQTYGDADGSVWETTVGQPTDIGPDVMTANEFNAEPPDGVVFAGFPVTMTLLEAGKEPLSTGYNFTWEILGGSSAAAYDRSTIDTESFGCGVVPDEFGDFDEVFVGGTLTGTVCIPIPVADLDHPDTQIALHFVANNTRIIFGL